MSVTKKANRTDLIESLAVSLGTSKSQAEKSLNSVLDSIVELVSKGYDVGLTGFGTFRKVTRKARNGINPKTGAKMKIPASISVGFKVGKSFKDSVK